ncbi:MAG: acylneuraminate cytidylyltransferase family protein [Planctomycetota bacterium]
MTPAPPPTIHADALLLVLARAGSKGLPDKNARPLAGRPMLAWSLAHAVDNAAACTLPAAVALTTDSERYAALAADHAPAARVVLRPPDLASDTATVDAAARHAVQTLEADGARTFAAVVLLYGNVPVRPPDLAARALRKLLDTGCDSVQSVCPVGKHHPYWMKTLAGPDGDALQPYADNTVYRRQDLPPVYQLDGGVLAVTRDALFTTAPDQPHAFLGQDRRAVVTQPGEVIDIDELNDLRLAESVLKPR